MHGTIWYMNRTALVGALLALSFLGIADSWYLLQSAVTDTALSCDIGGGLDGCNIVAQSPYSQFLGTPLALYGVGFYALMFLLAAVVVGVHRRLLYRALFWLATLGALASVVFLGIQFFLIQALCVYCIASAGITFLLWFLAHRLLGEDIPLQQ